MALSRQKQQQIPTKRPIIRNANYDDQVMIDINKKKKPTSGQKSNSLKNLEKELMELHREQVKSKQSGSGQRPRRYSVEDPNTSDSSLEDKYTDPFSASKVIKWTGCIFELFLQKYKVCKHLASKDPFFTLKFANPFK